MTLPKTILIISLVAIPACIICIGFAQTVKLPATEKSIEVEKAIAAEKKKADVIFNKIDSTHDKLETQVVKLAAPAKDAAVKKPKVKVVYITRVDTVYLPAVPDTTVDIIPVKAFITLTPPPVKKRSFFQRLFAHKTKEPHKAKK